MPLWGGAPLGNVKPQPGLFLPDPMHDLSQGLIGAWLLNDGSGDTVRDYSSGGNDGTSIHSPLWTPGRFGWALSYDGTNDYTQIPAIALNPIEASNAFTISAWVYNTDLTQDGTVLGQYGAAAVNQFLFYMDVGGGGNGYRGGVAGAGTTFTPTTTNDAIQDAWQHVAMTWDGVNVVLYVDGVVGGTASGAQTINTGGATAYAAIGSNDGASASRLWPGLIDHVYLYDRTLSALEVAVLNVSSFAMFAPSLDLSIFGTGAVAGSNLLAASYPYAGSETNLTTIAVPG